jgi:predicted ArsR family transcriptional regulator
MVSDQPDLFGDSPPTYPDVPGFKERTTSREAARAMEPRAGTLKAKALAALAGGRELTADEIADEIGATPFAVRPRVTELFKLHLIEWTGRLLRNKSGMNAHVWRKARV